MPNVIKQIVNGQGDSQTIKMVVKDSERGPQGEQGDPGAAATITAGSAYSLDYGQQPQVMNSGTSSAATFDFYIPEGKPGAIHYTAGPGINITDENVIEATGGMAVYWGDLTGNISNQTDLKNILNTSVVKSLGSVTTSSTNVAIGSTSYNIFDGTSTSATTTIPQATSTKAGVIDSTSYAQISTNKTDITNKLSYSNLTVNSTMSKTVTGSGTNTAIELGVASGGVDTGQIADSAITKNKINVASVIDIFYPVGSYYETSDTSFDPNVSWGGTWSEDSAGRVTVATDTGTFTTVGATGGEETHTLVEAELPAHDHFFYQNPVSGSGSGEFGGLAYVRQAALSADAVAGNTSTTGSGDAHNNLQPYVVVKRWHRTA